MMDSSISIKEEREKVNHFTQQLVNSGYQWSQIREIVVSSLRSVVRKEKLHVDTGEARYKTRFKIVTFKIKKQIIISNRMVQMGWRKRRRQRGY